MKHKPPSLAEIFGTQKMLPRGLYSVDGAFSRISYDDPDYSRIITHDIGRNLLQGIGQAISPFLDGRALLIVPRLGWEDDPSQLMVKYHLLISVWAEMPRVYLPVEDGSKLPLSWCPTCKGYTRNDLIDNPMICPVCGQDKIPKNGG